MTAVEVHNTLLVAAAAAVAVAAVDKFVDCIHYDLPTGCFRTKSIDSC